MIDLTRVLYLVGVLFVAINVQIAVQYLLFRRRRAAALVTWNPPRPPFYGLFLWVGAVLGVEIIYKIGVLRMPLHMVFGETMMLVYYVYTLPLSLRIQRGLYEDGIWTDAAFMAYGTIGGLTWREGDRITLVLLRRRRNSAQKLTVPEPFYSEARRVLRDKIAAHDIHFTGKALDLGLHDERDDV